MAERRSFRQLSERSVAEQRPICLDTSAIIEYGNDGAIAALVNPLLDDVSIPLVYSTISIAEVLGRPARAGDMTGMKAIANALTSRRNTGVVPFDEQQAIEAAWVRAATRLKLPDCAVIAAVRTAKAMGFVGVDRAWGSRQFGVPFFYLPGFLDQESQ